jgi:hypothetical protein
MTFFLSKPELSPVLPVEADFVNYVLLRIGRLAALFKDRGAGVLAGTMRGKT